MEKLRNKIHDHVVLAVLLVLSGLCLAACGDDEETGPQGGSSGSNGDGDGDGDNPGDGDGDGDVPGDGDGDGDVPGDGDGDGDVPGDGDGDGDAEECVDAPEPTTNEEILNRPCPPTECEPFDNEDRLPYYEPGEPLPDTLD
jgi:hypothetical protein